MSIGVTFPFSLATGSLGYLEPTADVVSAIKSNLKSLLTTNWGERVMHPDLGCNLREFVFEQKNKQIRGAIADRIKSQLSRWMPFLTLTSLYILFPEDDPSVQEPGFKIQLRVEYGNIPIDVFQSFPVT